MMSPHSLDNPFHTSQLNQESPAHLMNTHLPPAEAQALTEALGEEDKPPKIEPQLDLPPTLDISMTGKEQKEVEKEPLWIKEDYIKWAESFGMSEGWVDETFEFQEDGTTVVNGKLSLINTKIRQLPIGLMEVKGNLYISRNSSFKLNGYPKKIEGDFECSYNNLTSLQGMPEKVGGNIYLEYTNISSLDGLPDKMMGNLSLYHSQLENLNGISKEISGNLNLGRNNQLTSLEALKGVKIGGDLGFDHIPATEIPEGIQIKGSIYIDSSQITLIADAKRKGYQVEVL